MGTYDTWTFYETFGGWPERGEAYPSDPDAARDAAEDCGGTGAHSWNDSPIGDPQCEQTARCAGCHDCEGTA